MVKLTYSNLDTDKEPCNKKINKFYKENECYLNELERVFNEDFNIPKQIIKDNIKRILVNKIENTIIGNSNNLQGKKINLYIYKTLKNFILYYSVMVYFCLLTVFGQKKKQVERIDILFDMHSSFINYYDLFYEKLSKYKLALFICTPDIFSIDTLIHKVNKIFIASHSKRFLRDISYSIIKKQLFRYFLYHKLSKEMGFNIVEIALILQKHIATHSTEVNGISSNIYISASHNGYSPLKYYIYKRSFKNIILIENGTTGSKTKLCYGDCYTYSDYYIAMGKNIDRKEFFELNCNEIKYWGSILVDKNIHYLKDKEINEVHDILFIEELFTILDSSGITLSLEFLSKFSNKYPMYNIIYRTRKNKRDLKDPNGYTELIKMYDKIISNSNIKLDNSDNPYKSVLKSKIILFSASTLGKESLAMDKKILTFDFDKQSAHPLSENDDICILIEKSYNKFEKKLLYLLENANSVHVVDFFKELKSKFINQNLNFHDEVCEIIHKEIKDITKENN